MQVVKWTFWGDPMYPEEEWTSEETDQEYESAVIDAIREHGYQFSGTVHQNHLFGTPVMSNGRQYNVSMRSWGAIMAKALGIERERAYVDWAWVTPPGETPKYPNPADWDETAEESAAREERWDKYCKEQDKEYQQAKERMKELGVKQDDKNSECV